MTFLVRLIGVPSAGSVQISSPAPMIESGAPLGLP
jgi:hypothetical protein